MTFLMRGCGKRVPSSALLHERIFFGNLRNFSLSDSRVPQLEDCAKQSRKGSDDEEDEKGKLKYEVLWEREIAQKRADSTYRQFDIVNRIASVFPEAVRGSTNSHKIVVWCSNDQLGMSRNKNVVEAAKIAIDEYGVGSGGTRNISGNTGLHLALEQELADLHKKDAALLMSSCYVANDSTLSTIGARLPDTVFISDEGNHASLIHGILRSRCEKRIFKHNDLEDLESKLKSIDINRPKVIVFESVYSMCGTVSPIKDICDLAKKYNALTYLDEVHSVGLYGKTGAGIAEETECSAMVDMISGTLGKAFGAFGGYVTGSSNFIDTIRSFAPGFIFTTSLPPPIAAAALASVRYLKRSNVERTRHKENVRFLKTLLSAQSISFLKNFSHIIPVIIGDSEKATKISNSLLDKYSIYIRAINYPTVPKGTERLRITPSSEHTPQQALRLVNALKEVLGSS